MYTPRHCRQYLNLGTRPTAISTARMLGAIGPRYLSFGPAAGSRSRQSPKPSCEVVAGRKLHLRARAYTSYESRQCRYMPPHAQRIFDRAAMPQVDCAERQCRMMYARQCRTMYAHACGIAAFSMCITIEAAVPRTYCYKLHCSVERHCRTHIHTYIHD